MAEITDQQIEIKDRAELSRFEIRVDGELAGLADYRLDEEQIVFPHTEVDPAYEGQGLGNKLVEFAVTDARARGLNIVPTCPFVKKWVEANPESK